MELTEVLTALREIGVTYYRREGDLVTVTMATPVVSPPRLEEPKQPDPPSPDDIDDAILGRLPPFPPDIDDVPWVEREEELTHG